jgi:hypothetical protein
MSRITATQRFKSMPCKYCDQPMAVGSNTRNAPYHLECAISTMKKNAESLHQKQGAEYERWKKAMLRFSETL